jgi:streptogramin lyase
VPTTFNCPKCGAPQDYQGGSAAAIQCPYCETTIIVPPELRPDAGIASAESWSQQSAVLLEIKNLLDQKQKIQAIKVYREHFGGGLKEAKDAVDAIERGKSVQVVRVDIDEAAFAPNSTTIQSSAGNTRQRANGCATAIVIVVVLTVAASIVIPLLAIGTDIFNAFAPAAPTPTRVVAKATAAPIASPTRAISDTPAPTPGFASAVKTFSQQGTAPGQLNDARRLAVDHRGNLFVGEYVGARVQRFDDQGKFQDQWNAGTSKQILLGLAADLRGNVYAVVNGGIKKFDGVSGKALGQLQYDVPGEGFDAIAVTPDGGVVGMWYERRSGLITSLDGYRERLVRFDREGKVKQVIENIINAQTDNLALDNEIAVDALGNLYILTDEREGAIFKFSPEGKLISRFGSRGNETGQMNSGYAIAVDTQGRVYVATSDGIMVFTSDGRYLDTFEARGGVRSIAFDAQNRLWVLSNDKITQYILNQK